MMIFEKPKHKKGNKHKHITNERFKEWTKCYLCECGATSKHEVYHNGSSYMRNMSIQYGAQIPLCLHCHELIHRNGKLNKRIKAEFQDKLMDKFKWTTEQFKEVFYENYL